MTAIAEAFCPEHSETPALGTCARCGRFTCNSCTLHRQGGAYCVQCVDRLQFPPDGPAPSGPDDSASLVAFYSVMLGGLGLCIPLFGWIALLLGTWELARIRNGGSPRGGRLMALSGIVLGVLSSVLWFLVVWLGLIDG